MDSNGKWAEQATRFILRLIIGLSFTVVCLVVLVIAQCGKAAPSQVKPLNVTTIVNLADVPRAAYKYRADLTREVRYQWGLDENPALFFAQVHQESGWRSDAKSIYAEGLAQFTPETAEWIQKLYPKEFDEFCSSLSGCPLDARWAMRALIVYDKRLYSSFPKSVNDERYAFMLVSYNGGLGWALKEQKSCAQKSKRWVRCDSNAWFNNVEASCLRARAACDESRGYPRKILFRWRPLYQSWLER